MLTRIPSFRLGLAAAAAVLAGALVACSSVTVNTDWNTTIDFTKYKTWDFQQDTLGYTSFSIERLRSDLATTLASRGLTRDTVNPQLILSYRVVLTAQTEYQTTGTGGWGGWGAMGTSTTTVQNVPVGGLVVVFTDPKINQLVWRGVADAQVSESNSGQNAQNLQSAIKQMFAQFPPKAGQQPGGGY